MKRLYRATFRGRWRGRGDDWADWSRTYEAYDTYQVIRYVYDLYDVLGPISVQRVRGEGLGEPQKSVPE